MAGTLLKYVANTQPDPLVASPAQGPTAQGALFVQGTNETAQDVSLEGVRITLTVGDAADDLSQTAPDPVAPAGWTPEAPQYDGGKVSFVFQPASGDDGTVPAGGSLTFQFNGLQINSTAGTCPVVVMEGSGGCTPPDCPTAHLSVTKFPQGWQPVLLIATPPGVTQGEPTVLSWTGPAGPTYTLEYQDPNTNLPITLPLQGQPAFSNRGQYPASTDPPLVLGETTVFTLTAYDPPYTQQQQATVTVSQVPAIQAYEGQLTGSGPGAHLLLNWVTQNAESCALSLVPDPVPTSSQFGPLLVPSASAPVLGSTMVLTATNGVGSVSAAVQVQWAVLPGAPVSVPGGAVAMAAAPDGTLLVQTIADANWKVQETTLYAFSPTADAAAPYQLIGSASASNVAGVAAAPGGEYVYTGGTVIGYDVPPTGQATTFTLSPAASQPLASVGTVTAGSMLQAVAVSPDGTLVYMAGTQYQAAPQVWTFQVQDGGGLQLLGSSAALPDAPWAAAVAPDGTLLVACIDPTGQAGTVAVLAPTGDDSAPLAAVGAPLAVGGTPVGIAVSPDGERAFVAGQDGTVTLLTPTGDAAAPWQIAASCQTGAQRVQGMAMSPDGWNAMVCDYAGGTVIPVSADPVADTPTLGVGSALPVGGSPMALAFSADGTRLVVGMQEGSLAVLVPVSVSGGVVLEAQAAAGAPAVVRAAAAPA